MTEAEIDKEVEKMMEIIQSEYTAREAAIIYKACRQLYKNGYRKERIKWKTKE